MMYSEVAWVLVSSRFQVQLQIILEPGYLPDYLSISYGYGEKWYTISHQRYYDNISDRHILFFWIQLLNRNQDFKEEPCHNNLTLEFEIISDGHVSFLGNKKSILKI